MTFEIGKPFIDLDYNVEALRRTITNLCVLYALVNANPNNALDSLYVCERRKNTSCVFYVYERRTKTQHVCSVFVSVGKHNVTCSEDTVQDAGSWPRILKLRNRLSA